MSGVSRAPLRAHRNKSGRLQWLGRLTVAESCPGYPARVREDDKWSGASRPAYGELRLDDPETDELDDEFIRRACDRRQRAQGQQRLQMEAHTRAVPRVTGSRPRLLSGFHSVAVMPDDNHEAKGHIVQSVHARDGVDPLDMPSRVAAGVNRGRKAPACTRLQGFPLWREEASHGF